MSEDANNKQEAYRVLARKYRPQNFDDLVGQDALVRTLKNAIDSGRIAHAFMLTGIRGVGKTTTARIIAKALNYTGADGTAGPTTGSTDDCEICKAISEDRHPDVMEMDAASRTGIDDIREILDGVRYAPTSARYKVYIIDEVHMLSKAAFNALLKTLEEPPEHVKFIFATTEIRKVPITVLSRCQRFDLRRIEAETLASYYGEIATKESVKAEEEALTLISRAADGSARDGLSLLDQAIALGDGKISAQQVKDMLGLADKSLILDLLENALTGKIDEALEMMSELYRKGADPIVIIQELLDLTHLLTKLRAVPKLEEAHIQMAKEEGSRAKEMSKVLSMPSLGRTWQILLKGLGEVNIAPNAQKAAEMIIIRLVYASNLPDPTDLVKKLKDQPAIPAATNSVSPAPASAGQNVASLSTSTQQTPPTPESLQEPIPAQAPATALAKKDDNQETFDANKIHDLRDVVKGFEANGMMVTATHVAMHVHLVKLAEGILDIRLSDTAPDGLSNQISQGLKSITGARWMVSVVNEPGAPTIAAVDEEAVRAHREGIMAQPLVKNIFELFPDSNLKNIYKKN